jgi:phosphotriesterase-related protein
VPIRTTDADIAPQSAGAMLPHEHLWAAFGRATGDADLEFTCVDEIVTDLKEACRANIRTVVDVTTEDMGANVERTAEVARRAGVQAVKSTGWFRSPTADSFVEGRTPDALAARLVDDLTRGFPGSGRRAGCLGEVGLSGSRPTTAEALVLDATAAAAQMTGAGVVLHTDDAENGRALVAAMLARGVAPDRLLVGHARAEDPFEWHLELAEQGSLIGFDQLGHPLREPVARVARRILELAARGWARRIVVSSDVGRRSRLRAFGGTGYASAVCSLLAELRSASLAEGHVESIAGETAAAFMAIPDRA